MIADVKVRDVKPGSEVLMQAEWVRVTHVDTFTHHLVGRMHRIVGETNQCTYEEGETVPVRH